MSRTFAAVLVLLVLAGIAWCVFESPPGDSAPETQAPKPGSRSIEAPSTGQATESENKTSASGNRQKLNDSSANLQFEEIPDAELLRVAIVMAGTGDRVSDAKVVYAGSAAMQTIPADKRRLLRKQGRGAALVEEVGFRARMDAEGVAMVRSDPRYLWVQALRGNLFGQLLVMPGDVEPRDGWRLELHPDARVQIRVIDRAGKPVPGIPLALQPIRNSAPHPAPLHPLGETDTHGSLTRDLGPVLANMDREGKVHGANVVVNLPGLTKVSVKIDRADPPRHLLDIKLPPTGRIRCEIVDSTDKPILGIKPTRVHLQGGRWWRDLDAAQPRNLFDRVALGQTYNLSAYLGSEAKQERIAGPTEADQEVVARFEFPAMGRVVIKITYASGAPFVSLRNYVNLVVDGVSNQQRRFDNKGVATFERVPLGQTLRARVSRPSIDKEVIGPVSAGQEVVAHLKIDESVTILTARLIDPKGTALAGQKARLKMLYDNGSGERILICDDSGRFHLPLPGSARRKLQHAVLRAADESGEMTRGSAQLSVPSPLPEGVTDLGDVVFTTRPILVSGRFVGYKPDRQSQPRVTIERHFVYQSRGKAVERWRSDKTMHLLRIGANRFEYRGEADPGRRRLRVTAQGYLPVEPIEFDLGTKDLDIPLQRGGALTIRVKTDETIRAEMIHARLVPVLRGKDSQINPDRNRSGSRRRPGEAEYRWVGLTPGLHRLELRLIGGKQPLLAIDDIDIVGGRETHDDRLLALDLRGKIRPITVKLVDPDGKALSMRSQAMLLVKPKGDPTDLEGLSIDYGQTASIAIGANPVDLWIVVDGYPLKEVLGVDRDTTVRMDPQRKIRFKFRGGLPTLPKGASLRLALRGTSTNPSYKGLRYRAGGRGGGLGGLFDSRSRMQVAKSPVVVGTVPRAGEHKVHCLLSGVGRQRSVKVTPAVIQVQERDTEQVFEIEVTQAAIEEASK